MDKLQIIKDTVSDGKRYVAMANPETVCSKAIEVLTEGDTIVDVAFHGGCHGNTQGISALVRGMKVKDAADRLAGINCHGRGTSCPDQLSKLLLYIIGEQVR